MKSKIGIVLCFALCMLSGCGKALQVLVNGIWYDLKMVDNACFHMDLYHLESNQEYTFECNWKMYFGQELPAGKYRLLKEIGLKETKKWIGFVFYLQ